MSVIKGQELTKAAPSCLEKGSKPVSQRAEGLTPGLSAPLGIDIPAPWSCNSAAAAAARAPRASPQVLKGK